MMKKTNDCCDVHNPDFGIVDQVKKNAAQKRQ